MGSLFPNNIDSFTDPLANSPLNSPSHAGQHQNLNDAVEKIETYMGLVKVVPTSAVNGTVGATGTVTIGNTVPSVTVNGAFSSLYDNYLIQVSGGVASTNNELRLKMGATASNYYYQLIYGAWANTPLAEGSKTASNWPYTGTGYTSGLAMNAFVYSPYLAVRTRMWANYFSGVGDVGTVSGLLDNSTQYTDFTVVANSGNITGGTITVYGYRK